VLKDLDRAFWAYAWLGGERSKCFCAYLQAQTAWTPVAVSSGGILACPLEGSCPAKFVVRVRSLAWFPCRLGVLRRALRPSIAQKRQKLQTKFVQYSDASAGAASSNQTLPWAWLESSWQGLFGELRGTLVRGVTAEF
jgi:hypothetical protein